MSQNKQTCAYPIRDWNVSQKTLWKNKCIEIRLKCPMLIESGEMFERECSTEETKNRRKLRLHYDVWVLWRIRRLLSVWERRNGPFVKVLYFNNYDRHLASSSMCQCLEWNKFFDTPEASAISSTVAKYGFFCLL